MPCFFWGDTGNSYLFEKPRWCRKGPVAGLDDQRLTGQKWSWIIHESMILWCLVFFPKDLLWFIHKNYNFENLETFKIISILNSILQFSLWTFSFFSASPTGGLPRRRKWFSQGPGEINSGRPRRVASGYDWLTGPWWFSMALIEIDGPYIWVNYNNSLTWIKAIWGYFPLLTMISSEVVVSSL